MAHYQQQEFFTEITRRFSDKTSRAKTILEVGFQNINGSVRDFFPKDSQYFGIDIGDAKDVDITIPGELLQLPDGWADIAISTECFEHASTWHEVLKNMIRCTKEGGLVLITCAGFGRATHGTVDSETRSSPFTNNYYLNLDPIDIEQSVKTGKYFQKHGYEVNSQSGDTYFWGVRTSNSSDLEYMELEDALARARGQIGKMAEKIAMQSMEIKYLKASGGKKLLLKTGQWVLKLARRVKSSVKDALT